jgi:ribonuclease P/MRP protein subunit POP3
MIISILSPIGLHRSNHVPSSKGKRDKKRKRKEVKSGTEKAPASTPPPPPAISSFVEVGLNSITRSLESLSKKSKAENALIDVAKDGDEGTLKPESRHFSAIFVLRSSQPSILHMHLPQLIRTASLAYPELPATRLVQLPNGCDARLCEVLGLPRVSFIGILDGAPFSKALVDLVRECVPEIEIPWLQEAKKPVYLPVKINTIETFAPIAKKEQTVGCKSLQNV